MVQTGVEDFTNLPCWWPGRKAHADRWQDVVRNFKGFYTASQDGGSENAKMKSDRQV
jgi:hypothetical protein